MPFLMPTCNSERKAGVFPDTPSHQIIESLKLSTKCLYNLLYIHQQGSAYFCRAAHTCPIARAPLAVLSLPVVATGTYGLTCEEKLFETQGVCTFCKCVTLLKGCSTARQKSLNNCKSISEGRYQNKSSSR